MDLEADDLANMLSDSDVAIDQSEDNDVAIDLNFVDYDANEESSNNNNNFDPFAIDDLDLSSQESSSQEDESANKEIENFMAEDIESDHAGKQKKQQKTTKIELTKLHRWPQPGNDSFAARVINIEFIPVSMTEQVILQNLFHDIPPESHPIDIRIAHHRQCFFDKEKNYKKSYLGYAHLVFENTNTVKAVMPILKEKQGNPKHIYRLFRKKALTDIITHHSLHHDLKDNTLRLVFINLHWKCKALNIYQFIKNNTNNNRRLLPMKIQIIENSDGYSTGIAFVDFSEALIASKVLFACHDKALLNRQIYVDWHPYPKRIETWIEQQMVLKKQQKTERLLIYNLYHKITRDEMESFIEKHLKKIEKNTHNVMIKDIQVIHNRINPLLCGYCLVSFVNKTENQRESFNVFEVINKLKERIEYKVLWHRSILVMFARNKSKKQNRHKKNIELKHKTHFLMFDNLVCDINKINLNDFINKINIDCVATESKNIMIDEHGYCVCEALLKCVSPEIATQIATELDGKLCRDRMVCIDWCDESKYKAIQSKYKKSFMLNLFDFSSYFDVTQMKYLNDQLFGDNAFKNNRQLLYTTGINKKKTKNKAKNKANNPEIDEMSNNVDIIRQFYNNVQQKRKSRKAIFAQAKQSMVDEKMLKKMKEGKTLKEARPKTPGELNKIKRRGKIGLWTKLGMSKSSMQALKRKIDWNTGKSVLSKVIAAKNTIHVKDRWADSIKFSRRRVRNRYYIQKSGKHNTHRIKKPTGPKKMNLN